jgi:CRP-like cAMP-binding protein
MLVHISPVLLVFSDREKQDLSIGASVNEEFVTIVTNFRLFKGYTTDGAKRILSAGEVKNVSAGKVIFKEGDPATFVLLVLKGKLQSMSNAKETT